MANSTRLKGNIGVRGKRRLVTKTKWELPFPNSKSYWDKICNDLESKVSMTVRNPSSSTPMLYPIIFPPSIRYSAASNASCDGISVHDFSKRLLTSELVNSASSQSITKGSTSLPYSRDAIIGTKLLRDNVTFSPDLIEYSNDRPESSKNHSKLTKLSKITKLVNDFLSSTRTRVTPTTVKSKKFSSITKRSSVKNRDYKSLLMNEASFDARSKKDFSECESFVDKKSQEKLKVETGTLGGTVLTKRSVGFRDDLEEKNEKDFDKKNDIVVETKPRRARAPSLSVASAVPSFGRVVISIEDIDSTENEEEYDKPLESANHVTSKDYRKTIEPDGPEADDSKSTQDFLKVPQVKSAISASYPTYDGSKYQRQNESSETRLAEEAYASKLLRESSMFRKTYRFWPKRSIVHVFRALKTMKNGLKLKARIESETNRFFASPLDTYSPTVRSSMSSDEQTDFIDANISESASEQNDDEIIYEGDDVRNGSREKIDRESNSSSYASVRQRLMRNAVAHLSKDSQRNAAGTCIDTNNALEAKSGEANPSSFYNSWVTSKNEVVEKHRNKKTLERHFIGIPRVSRIFPRVKADKCFACMCQSLGGIDQPQRRKKAGTFLDDGIDELVLDNDEPLSEIFGFDLSPETSFDQFYRDRYQAALSTDKSMAKSSAEDHPARSLIPDSSNDQVIATDVEDSRASVQKSVIAPLRTTSQIKDPHRSRKIVKAQSKALISAKSLITSLSLVSERSRSISDQDDSDQGHMDPVENEIGLGEGSTSKNLASCHMPINLKPSLEPLKALRSKKSRSIRSRVASAEKSADSANDDDADSDYEEDIRKEPLNEPKNKSDAGRSSMEHGTVSSPKGEKMSNIGMKKDGDVPSDELINTDRTQSIVEPEETSKIDVEKISKNDFSHNVPVISDREVIEISRKCLQSNMTITEILRILVNEYSKRFSDRYSKENRLQGWSSIPKNEKIAINLLALLVESRSYLNREKQSKNMPDLTFSSKQPSLCNSRQLRRILPLKSFNLIAPILGMSKWYPSRNMGSLREIARSPSRMDEQEKFRQTTFDLIVHPPSRLEQAVCFEKNRKDSRPKLSPYSLFLVKPRRKAITWRPLTERDLEGYDPEATLKMRAAKITDRICEDFCHWLESLAAGTNQPNGIDVEVLKDMFETDFTAEVCSTMQISFKEMPMVPTAVATARNCPGAGELALTRRHLVRDARAEMRPKRTIGFGTSLPADLKFIPPRNRVDEKWLQCENVPKDLETMEAVWKGITHLASVKGFINWLRAHPEVKRPKALENMLPLRETLGTRQSMINGFKHLELDLDQIQSLKVGDNAPDVY